MLQRLSPGSASPVSSNTSGAPKQAAAQTPVKTENCCVVSPLGAHVADVIPLQGNLLDAEFRTDDFRINHFKVTDCSNLEPHDWTLCAYAHVGEKARRRGTAEFKYVATACPDFRKGTCKRGDGCPFAHGVFESWLHPGRYRTQLCKDGLDCDRPVCFFAHSMKELRTPTLPISLAHSPDGAAFAAFFGGPSLGSLKAPSLQPKAQQQLQPHPPPLSKQASLQAATRQQQQAMQVLQQQQAALKQGQEALRQEQLNLQAAAMRLREQYAVLTQQQQGLAAQQPSSPMASSSCESEGAAAHLPGSFSGSDDDVIFAPEQLRRAAHKAEASYANGVSAGLPAESAPVSQAALAAWLATRTCVSSTAMRSASQLGSMLECLPCNGQVYGPAHCPPSFQDLSRQPLGSLPMGVQHQEQIAAAFRASDTHHAAASRPQSQPPTSPEAILPLSVPPVLAAIWAPPAVSAAASWNGSKPRTSNQPPPPPPRGLPLSVQHQLSAC
ncbi:hypothetical protein WJX75_006072 [Coccomyxa subellipsoidea]|uniref:C3H1-type domain-containing protein n=1 Tax=Coccomyxa subellipsoidea TaxID=248742 RepID=A0ABR2YTP5_9CHLO